jgi:phospholipid/cholesterol/gamma-HCH transport system substrate-binding protein
VQAVVLGLFVLAGLVLGGFGLFSVGSRQWVPDAFTVRATFKDVGGVETGTRVRIQGIDAGEVTAIELPEQPGGEVLLRLRLAGRFRHLVTKDARVEIASESLLAGKVVRIVPGRAAAGVVGDDALLAGAPSGDISQELTDASVKLNRALGQVNSVIDEFRHGDGPIGQTTKDLNDAALRLNKVLAKADATLTDVQSGKGTLGKLLKDEKVYKDLSLALAQINLALAELREGKGTLGKLMKNNEMYAEAVKSLQDMRQMVASVKQNADAMKSLPVVRNYVVDVSRELNRPDCRRYRKYYAEKKLFEPGRAVLTDGGKEILDGAADWLNDLKEAGSEVVVAAFADPKLNSAFAQTLTEKQSQAVVDYLKTNHRVHRMGFWWWSNRTVRALGCGNGPSPVPERQSLPPARVELLVFVPER